MSSIIVRILLIDSNRSIKQAKQTNKNPKESARNLLALISEKSSMWFQVQFDPAAQSIFSRL